MADTKPAAPSPAPKPAPEVHAPAETHHEADHSKSVGDEIQAHHHARTTVPGRDGVDARLDNRPPEAFEEHTFGPDDPKPQHVDGPDVAGQIAHTRKVLAKKKG